MASKGSSGPQVMWENHRRRKEIQFRQRERKQRLQDATIVKSDQDLIEDALASGRFSKCAPGATSGDGSDGDT